MKKMKRLKEKEKGKIHQFDCILIDDVKLKCSRTGVTSRKDRKRWKIFGKMSMPEVNLKYSFFIL